MVEWGVGSRFLGECLRGLAGWRIFYIKLVWLVRLLVVCEWIIGSCVECWSECVCGLLEVSLNEWLLVETRS